DEWQLYADLRGMHGDLFHRRGCDPRAEPQARAGKDVRTEMTRPLKLDPDRLFPTEERARGIARALYGEVAGLPIISPHGHTDPTWLSTNANWSTATELLLSPDHYLYRMLYSQGVNLADLCVPDKQGAPATDPRQAWRVLAENFHLFRGTPSSMWLSHV